MEMVLLMCNDNVDNGYCKYLKDNIKRQDEIIEDLEEKNKKIVEVLMDDRETIEYQKDLIDKLEEDKRIFLNRIRLKNVMYASLLEEKKELEATILAYQSRAAELEHRANEEKFARLMLKMRV